MHISTILFEVELLHTAEFRCTSNHYRADSRFNRTSTIYPISIFIVVKSDLREKLPTLSAKHKVCVCPFSDWRNESRNFFNCQRPLWRSLNERAVKTANMRISFATWTHDNVKLLWAFYHVYYQIIKWRIFHIYLFLWCHALLSQTLKG